MTAKDSPLPPPSVSNERWWIWPAILVALAAICFGVARLFEPGADEFCYVLGHRFGDTCQFTLMTGYPCPQCGMTRSWVWAARLELSRSFYYNPAGLTLFLWIQTAGVIGLARLAFRNPSRLKVSSYLLFSWVCFWIVGLYALPWFGRLAGYNPLP